MKKSIKEKLQLKKVKEINSIAKRINYPLYGNKRARIHQLCGYFNSSKIWDAIVNGNKFK